jgi:hypothetical protein
MKKLTHIILIILGLGLSACERLVTNVDVPVAEQQLVLFSFISPEEQDVRVELTLSKPIYGKNTGGGFGFEYVKNAVVTITKEGGQAVILNYVDSINAYQVSQSLFKIEPGKTYQITAVTSAKSVKASCVIPKDSATLTELVVNRLATQGSNSFGPYYRYNYRWVDLAESGNYYRIALQQYVNFQSTKEYFDICNSFYDDDKQNGATLTGTCEDYTLSGDSNYRVVYLLTTDVHYFEYMRRRVNYYGDDPFSEPFPQYSNVQGGLGVFCSFRKTSRELAFAR